MADVKNFSYSGVVAPPVPPLTGTTIGIAPGDAALFALNRPAVIYPLAQFPRADNAEIVMVTGIAGDTLTVTRAIEGSTPRAVQLGDQIAQVLTAAMWNSLLVGTVVSSISGTPGEIVVSTPTGDVVISLPNVNPTPGTFGSSTLIPVITVDAKGRLTLVGTAPLAIGGAVSAETLTGVFLAPNVKTASIDTLTGGLTAAGDIFGLNLTGTNTGDDAPNPLYANVAADAAADATAKADAAQAASQPLDSDLTAIAALTTLPYGRGFLALADQAAAQAYIGALAGNYITSLTGDVTATGPGAAAATLATVNANVGTFGSGSLVPVITVDAKGRITSITTAAVSGGGGGTGANPTASIGLTAINGVATTFMRSDAAPALSQAIAPVWTNDHIWDKGNNDVTLYLRASAGRNRLIRFFTGSTTLQRWVFGVDSTAEGGSNAGSNFIINRYNDAAASLGTALGINRATGLVTIGAGLTAVGAIAASNFSGSSSGTNTGDQNLSGYALLTGAAFSGAISATNFSGTHSGSSSGTNTGDQNLSGYAPLTGAAFSGPVSATSLTSTGGVIYLVNNSPGSGLAIRFNAAGVIGFTVGDQSSYAGIQALTGTFVGNITAANFSGSHSGASSGTNTGDQNLSGYAPLTGAGASGTWAINITGSAASATNATNATNSTNALNFMSTSHTGSFWLVNNWDGTYWSITSNHGAPARVGYADVAGSVTSLGAMTSIGVTANGATADYGGAIAVAQPNNTTDYSYYGMVKNGVTKMGMGITSGNRWWFGSATGPGPAAVLNGTPWFSIGPNSMAWHSSLSTAQIRITQTVANHAAMSYNLSWDTVNWHRDNTGLPGTAMEWRPDQSVAWYNVAAGANPASLGAVFNIGPGNGCSVPGSLSKGSGTFRIDHPLPAKANTHYLVHSFIEGPRADLIYRGRATLVAGTVNVDLDVANGMSPGTWALLCRDPQVFVQCEDNFLRVRGKVIGSVLSIFALTPVNAVINWMVIAERQDAVIKAADWTDIDGHPVIEPEKRTNEYGYVHPRTKYDPP